MGCRSSGGKEEAPAAQDDAKVREPTLPDAPAVDPRAARTLLQRFECNRCHHGTGLDDPPAPKNCVGCHEALLAESYEGEFSDQPQLLAEWKENIVSLPAAPELASMGRRLRRDWVRGQLLRPRDQRPHLPASMPRLSMNDDEASLIASYLVPSESPAASFDKALIPRGRELFGLLGCGSCHEFTGATLPAASALPKGVVSSRRGRALAPDLRHTRERFQSGALLRWLKDPRSIDAKTEMPVFALSDHDAQSLAAFVWESDLAPAAELPPSSPSAAPAKTPDWELVSERVFKKLCWHCHSSKAFARGDGGPGNTGGFGFEARGLDLSSYEGVMSGAIGPDGKRRSIFARDPDGQSRLMRVLRLRQQEERGHYRDDLRGMPLGFPSLSEEDLSLLQAWIDAGRPR